MARQQILARTQPPTISFVRWKAILMDRIGGDLVYAESVRPARACTDLRGFSLQVVAAHPAAVHVRDSKSPTGSVLTLAQGAWKSLVAVGR
ncbi:DUF397 domain-containing protein [Streptomyces sp. NBC_01310]|nr:DUF397 domain-containing protein [Streptomyces sp. NBC_01310]